MAKPGRKRKIVAEKENAVPPKKSIGGTEKTVLEQKEWIPEAAVEFFKSKGYEKMIENLLNMDNEPVLVGPFRQLRGEIDVSGIELIMLDREETDLPEMQTFLKCTYGRYAFWRDSPADTKPMIVFVEMKSVPEVSLVGNKVEHAIFDLCERHSKYKDNSAKSRSAEAALLKLLEVKESGLVTEIKRVTRDRKHQTVGGFSGPGLILNTKTKGRKGYINTPHNTKNIQALLRSLCLIGKKQVEDEIVTLIDALMGQVMVCNDEGDFGNGLELGHLLFLVNKTSVLEPMKMILTCAYRLLNRTDFEKILNITLELRKT